MGSSGLQSVDPDKNLSVRQLKFGDIVTEDDFLCAFFFVFRSAEKTSMDSRSSSTDSYRSKVPRWIGLRSTGRQRTR